MPLPSISMGGSSLPLLIWTLLIWTVVTALCGALLLLEALVLALRAKNSGRWLALVPLAEAIAAFVLANQTWTAYFRIACPYNSFSHPPPCFDPKLAAQAVAQFQPLGWATVGVTVVLLVAGIIGLRQARRAAS
jgi:hypothetical protein